MDDNLEDEVFYQTIMSHARIISRFVLSIPFHASFSNVTRYAKFYLTKPECILAVIVTVLVLALFNNLDSLLKSAAGKLHYVGATYTFVSNLSFKDHRPSSAVGRDDFDGRAVPAFRKDLSTINDEIGPGVTWKLKQDNVGVYSVKGRRPHMEDRFSLYQHKHFTLYGIFDGHGGEVCFCFFSSSSILYSIQLRCQTS